MARKGSTKGKYIKGNVDEILSLGTLASVTVIGSNFDEVVNEKTLISSLVAAYALEELTSPQGPILFGVAHSDYTDAEIEEVLENIGSWDTGDKISQERGKRLVRVIGIMTADDAVAGTTDVRFNGGDPVKTKLNWMLDSGDTIKLWAYNKSASALATTVPILVCSGHANLWQR